MKSLLVKCTALVLVTAATAFAQVNVNETLGRPALEGYQFDYAGSGARAFAMGNAYLGLSNDVTAVSWNPAGLFNLSQPVLSASYGSMMPRGETQTDFYMPGGLSGFDHSGSISGVTALNFAAPIRIKGHPFVGSFAYNSLYNEYQAIVYSYGYSFIYEPRDGALDTAEFDAGVQSELEGGLKNVSFGFGTRIHGNLSAGVALNVYTGDVVRETVERSGSGDLLDNFLQTYTSTTTATVIDSNKFSGYNFTLGFKYEGLMTGKLGLGLVIRTPFDLEVETDRSYYIITDRNGLIQDAGTDTIYFDNLLAKYESPWMIGLGGAYQMNERTTLTADVEFRNFSSRGVQLRDSLFLDPGGENEEFYTEVSSDTLWSSVFQFRLGAEHLLQHSWGTVPVRAGFAYVPATVQSYEPDSLVMDQTGATNLASTESRTNGMRLSLGTGIWWKQIHLDFGYAYMTRDWDTGTPGYARTGLFHQKFRNHTLNATFTGYF